MDEIIDEENEGIERIEEEQERGEDQEMMEGHPRNHIGINKLRYITVVNEDWLKLKELLAYL